MGTWFACTMFAGEVLFQASTDNLFPKFLQKENSKKAPTSALLMSNIFVQIFLFSLIINQSAYNFMAVLASSTMLVTYLLITLAQIKLPGQGKKKTGKIILGILASAYLIFAIYASGLDYILLTSLLFAPSILIFMYAQKEQNMKKIFTNKELIYVIILVILGIISIMLIANGTIDITTM